MSTLRKCGIASRPIFGKLLFAFFESRSNNKHPTKAWCDKLVSLVERMLELHKRSPRLPQEQEMVKREIESTLVKDPEEHRGRCQVLGKSPVLKKKPSPNHYEFGEGLDG